jgi:PAS domain S-box-containing protein
MKKNSGNTYKIVPKNGHKPKEIRDILIVTFLCLGFSLISVILRLSSTLGKLVLGFVSEHAVEYATQFIFLYLMGLLLIAYRRWRKAFRRERELEAIISSISPDVLVVVDRDRNIRMCNPSIKRMFGYDEAEVLNKKTDHLYSDRRSSPDQYHEIYDALEKEGYHVGVATGKRRDGRPLPLEIISGEMKESGGAVLLLRDISARVQAEDALRETRQRYTDIVNNALVGIFQCAPDGRFVTANTSLARLFGYNTSKEITAPGHALAGPVFVDAGRAAEFKGLLNARDHLADFELRLARKSGDPFWASINARTVRDAQGALVSYEGTIEDVTVRKEAEVALTQSLERLRKVTGTIIDVMIMAVEARDPYTSGHQQRVADLARAIGTEMGLPEDQLDGLRVAGVVHDLGKISIPTEILTNPRKLTDIELQLVRTHSQIGYDLIKDIQFPWPIAQMILQHHERLDGSGYPRGLRGEEIMLEARILMVADIVEAISSHRPYRPALGVDKALEEIAQGRGTIYDADVVDVCLRLFREKAFKFE